MVQALHVSGSYLISSTTWFANYHLVQPQRHGWFGKLAFFMRLLLPKLSSHVDGTVASTLAL